MKKVFLLPLAFVLTCFAQQVPRTLTAMTLAVTNTAVTPIVCTLDNVTTVQVYIRPSSTAQIYTITLNDNSTIEVPSGQTFTYRSVKKFSAGQQVFSAQTATSSVNLQVIFFQEM